MCKRMRRLGTACALALAVAASAAPAGAQAGAILNLPGCRDHVLARNDDGSSGLVQLPFTLDFLGTQRSAAYVNNNGNITFDQPLATFTPFRLENANREIIAPFFADVDTRNAASDVVTWGETLFEQRDAFCVEWAGSGVGYYNARADKLNKFELLIVDRSDISPGDADVYFNYDQVQWETGDASGGVGGLGGFSARVGYSNGTGEPDTSFELPGSAVNGAFLDGNTASGLIWGSLNSTVLGRYLFQFRNGFVVPNVPPVAVVTATPDTGPHPLPVTFDASASLDEDGEIVSWRLDFGDGSDVSGTGQPPASLEHVYTAVGNYEATLDVVDDEGAADEATVTISVRRATTAIDAQPAVAEVVPAASVFFPELAATLTRRDPATPLPGRELAFYAGGDLLCTATTDADGRAFCGDVESSLATFPTGGYQVDYGGDGSFLPSSDRGPLVRAAGSDLP